MLGVWGETVKVRCVVCGGVQAWIFLFLLMVMMGNFYPRVLDDMLVHRSCSWEVFVVVFLGVGSAVGNALQYYM